MEAEATHWRPLSELAQGDAGASVSYSRARDGSALAGLAGERDRLFEPHRPPLPERRLVRLAAHDRPRLGDVAVYKVLISFVQLVIGGVEDCLRRAPQPRRSCRLTGGDRHGRKDPERSPPCRIRSLHPALLHAAALSVSSTSGVCATTNVAPLLLKEHPH